jgi:hypothetical protein
MQSRCKRSLGLSLIALVIVLGASGRDARALNELRPFLEEKISVIRDELRGAEPLKVSVGVFHSNAEFGSSQGPGITQEVIRALKQRQILDAPDAPIEIHGQYYPTFEPGQPKLIAGVGISMQLERKAPHALLRRIDFELNGRDGRLDAASLRNLIDELFPVDVVPHLGVAVGPITRPVSVVPVKGVQVIVDPPGRKLYGLQVRENGLFVTSPDDLQPLYGLQIGTKVGGEFRPITPSLVGMKTTVDLPGGDPLVIRLFNNTKEEAAVQVTLDGVSLFAFIEENGGKPYEYVCLPPSKSQPYGEIPGWYVTAENAMAFRLVDYSNELASARRLSQCRVGEAGVISAYFSRCSVDKLKGDATHQSMFGVGEIVPASYREKVQRYVSKDGHRLNLHYRLARTESTPAKAPTGKPLAGSAKTAAAH